MSRTGHVRAKVVLAVICVFLLGGPLLAWAHTDVPPTVPLDRLLQHAARFGALLTFAVAVLLAMARVRPLRRWRGAAALTLTLCLGVFTFGMAVHAVHHLPEPEKAAQCLVFLASQHASGALTQPCDVSAPALTVIAVRLSQRELPTVRLCVRCDLPRAPPLIFS